MKLFRKLFKRKRKDVDQIKLKLERIGLVVVKEMKSNRGLRRKLKGTRLESVIHQIINEK